MHTTFPGLTISKDDSPLFSTDSIIETRQMAPTPSKGNRARRPADQCLHVVRPARSQKRRRDANQNRELSPESIEEATFMAALTPDRAPEEEKEIYRYRMRRAGYKKPPIQLGSPEHTAVLEVMGESLNEDTVVAGSPEYPSRRPSRCLSQNLVALQPAARAPELAPRLPDWRARARKIIEKKSWSLDKEMGHSTWKQKVSNDQRLLLLEDDGYDISTLLLKGTSADDIITVILARVAARRKDRLAAAAADSSSKGGQAGAMDEVGQAATVSPTQYDKTVPGDRETIHHAAWDGETLVEDDREADALEPPVFVIASVIGRKRKHTDEEDEHENWYGSTDLLDGDVLSSNHTACSLATYKTGSTWSCSCGPIRQKLRTKEPKEVEEEEKDLARNMRKTYGLQDIFTESRMARISSLGPPNGGYAPSFSEVIFTPPVPLPHPDAREAAYMNSRGLQFILDEIMYLSSEQRADGTLLIRDSENEENPIEVISQGPKNPIKLIGETMALKRLFIRLRDCKLLHASECSPVELCWKKTGEVGSLGEQTEYALTMIIKNFSTGRAYRGISFTVPQYLHGGTKLRWT